MSRLWWDWIAPALLGTACVALLVAMCWAAWMWGAS